MSDYSQINARKLADGLTASINEQTRGGPREERYGLTSQLRHAVSSVAANMVEGSARETQMDYRHFLHFARASLPDARSNSRVVGRPVV